MGGIGDTEAVIGLARRCRVAAERVDEITRRVEAELRAAVWVGPPAALVRARAANRTRQGASIAGELRAAAHALDEYAARIAGTPR